VKDYTLTIKVQLAEGSPDTYSPKCAVQFDIKELLPVNVDAQSYVKRRLAEEVKRHFDAMTGPVDNLTDEAKQADDPLAR
jgi:hypothetical protein